MNVDDLYGTLYVPKDGTMDPAGTCTTLSRAASARGAKVGRRNRSAGGGAEPFLLATSCFPSPGQVIENCPVTGVQVRTDDLGVRRVKAVETPHGTIETPCVVNCAGRRWGGGGVRRQEAIKQLYLFIFAVFKPFFFVF